MSPLRSGFAPPPLAASAELFAALGDPTRLQMVSRLCAEGPASITHLTAGTEISRQAVTKHLRILAEAGLVRGMREGRQSAWAIQPDKLDVARHSLEQISKQWDERLLRLKAFVEK